MLEDESPTQAEKPTSFVGEVAHVMCGTQQRLIDVFVGGLLLSGVCLSTGSFPPRVGDDIMVTHHPDSGTYIASNDEDIGAVDIFQQFFGRKLHRRVTE